MSCGLEPWQYIASAHSRGCPWSGALCMWLITWYWSQPMTLCHLLGQCVSILLYVGGGGRTHNTSINNGTCLLLLLQVVLPCMLDELTHTSIFIKPCTLWDMQGLILNTYYIMRYYWKWLVHSSPEHLVDHLPWCGIMSRPPGFLWSIVMFLPWTALDSILTSYDYGPGYIISHGLVIKWRYHMYNTDSFLGSLY